MYTNNIKLYILVKYIIICKPPRNGAQVLYYTFGKQVLGLSHPPELNLAWPFQLHSLPNLHYRLNNMEILTQLNYFTTCIYMLLSHMHVLPRPRSGFALLFLPIGGVVIRVVLWGIQIGTGSALWLSLHLIYTWSPLYIHVYSLFVIVC